MIHQISIVTIYTYFCNGFSALKIIIARENTTNEATAAKQAIIM